MEDKFDALVDDLAKISADPGRGRRLGISFVSAAVVTAIVAAVATSWQPPRGDSLEQLGPVSQIVLEHRPPPTPRPTAPPTAAPTPRPTEAPPAPIRTTAPIAQHSAPRAVHVGGGTSAAPTPAPHLVVAHRHAVPNAGGTVGAAAMPGNGTGDDPGSGSGDAVGLGDGGAGGAGNDVADAQVPCGYVEFIPTEAARYSGTTAYEQIRATVHYPDGHAEDDEFPYAWVYPNGAVTDPWSAANLRRRDADVRAQLPPPGANTSRYPDVIKYVLEHTTPDGITVLHECPHRG